MEEQGARRRLFLALWPEEAQRQQLAGIQQAIGDQGGRQVAPANFHVTAAFLGNVTAARQAEAERLAARWSCADELRFIRLAYWPKARLVCLEAPEPPAVFLEAIARLHEDLRQAGFAIEARPFRAHVTLVRNVAGLPMLPSLAHEICWPVTGLVLVASSPAAGGSVYSMLASWPAR